MDDLFAPVAGSSTAERVEMPSLSTTASGASGHPVSTAAAKR
jgi:hypothetical protein